MALKLSAVRYAVQMATNRRISRFVNESMIAKLSAKLTAHSNGPQVTTYPANVNEFQSCAFDVRLMRLSVVKISRWFIYLQLESTHSQKQ